MFKIEDFVSLEVMLNIVFLIKVFFVIVVYNINIGFYIFCLSEILKFLVLIIVGYLWVLFSGYLMMGFNRIIL